VRSARYTGGTSGELPPVCVIEPPPMLFARTSVQTDDATVMLRGGIALTLAPP
jgi:hypothetical protein